MKRSFSDGFLELISVLTALCFLCCCTTTKINTRRVPVYGEKEDQPINKPRYTSREPYFQLYNQKAEIQTASSQIPPLFAMLRFERESFNPFLEKIGIIFENPKKEYIRISISDRTLSQNLKVLAEETMDVGRQTVYWDGKGDDGEVLKDGQYYIVIEGENIKPIFRKIEVGVINLAPFKNRIEYKPPVLELEFKPEYESKETTHKTKTKGAWSVLGKVGALLLLLSAFAKGGPFGEEVDREKGEEFADTPGFNLFAIGGSLMVLEWIAPSRDKYETRRYKAPIEENIYHNKRLREAERERKRIERENKKIDKYNRKIKESAIMKVRFID